MSGLRRQGRGQAGLYQAAVLLAATALLAACTGLGPPPTVTALPPPSATPQTPDPQGTAATFLDLWRQGDYAGMYSLLSPLSQASCTASAMSV